MKKSLFILLLLLAGISYDGDIGENIIQDTNCYSGIFIEHSVEEDTIVNNEINLFRLEYYIIYNKPAFIPLENYTPVWKPPVNS